MVQHPEVLWAQRSSETDAKKNVLYITVNLPDIRPATLKCEVTPTSIDVKAKAGNELKDYAFHLDLYEEIVPEESIRQLTSRFLFLSTHKKVKKREYWPRLTKEKIEYPFVKKDFSKWVDEDEQEEDHDVGGIEGMWDMMMQPGSMDCEKMMADLGANAGVGAKAEESEDEA